MERRRIDNKFHIEGDQIVKTANGEAIPDNEPLFLMRGRDRLAIPMLKIYAELSKIDGCNDYHFDKLRTTLSEFEEFAARNPEKMKQPSITRGL